MATIGIQVIAGVAIVLTLNLQCIPHKAIYDLTVPGKCIDLHKIQLTSASIHLTCDVIMLLLPQPVIWTLKMTWRKRLGVSFVFSLGVLYVYALSRPWIYPLKLTSTTLQGVCLRST